MLTNLLMETLDHTRNMIILLESPSHPCEVTRGFTGPVKESLSSICCSSHGTRLENHHHGTVVTPAARQNTCNHKNQYFFL